MKANKAPQRVYCESDGLGNIVKVHNVKWPDDEAENIEYTNTDAFIEKACEWIREFNNHHYIMRYSDSCEPPLSELTEWFKNYMKGE